MVQLDYNTRNVNLVSLQRVMEEEEEKRLLLFLFRYLTIKKEETNQLHRNKLKNRNQDGRIKQILIEKNYNIHFI